MNYPRNIIAIDRVSAVGIVGLQRTGELSVLVDDNTPWENIPVKIPAKMTITEKIDDGVRLYTAQLVFKTCMDLTGSQRFVYRCQTADGRYYLIGGVERPYPVTTLSRAHPDNMSDNQLDEVTVNYTSVAKIPYIQ